AMDLVVAADHRSEPRPGTRKSGRIACAPGFDLGRSLAFLDGFGPMGGEQVIEGAELTKAVMLGGRLVLVQVRGEETRGRPEIAYRLASKHTLSPVEEAALAQRIAFFLSAGEDLSPFVRLAAADPCFAPVAARLAGLHHVKFPTPFEAATWGVINQRIQRGRAQAMKDAASVGYRGD